MGNPRVLLIVALSVLAAAPQPVIPAASKETVIAPGEIDSQLPAFSIKDRRGHKISSADLRGKVVLIDFWATWCQPCKKEMPGCQALLDKYGSRGFAVIGLKFDTMMDSEDPLRPPRNLAKENHRF